MQLLEALDQIKGRGEGALGRLPGVGHRPEPGQIEVGMAQHMKATCWRFAAAQLGKLSLGFSQQTRRVGWIQGLELKTALDQGTVVVNGAAQA